MFDTQYGNIRSDTEGIRIKNIITNADNLYLKEAKRIYANSQNVSKRMLTYNTIKSTPLYHPCPDMEKFYCKEYEDYILMPSRINMSKRQLLAIEAMRYVRSDLKLYIVGMPDNEVAEKEVKNKISKYKLQNKIKYLGAVTQDEKIKLYASARAVLFIPLDEDYGYITLEAMSASKAVITARDSGGPLEFVENGKSGLVTDPEAKEIAKVIDEFASAGMCKQFGFQAKKHISDMNISWNNVVKELTK